MDLCFIGVVVANEYMQELQRIASASIGPYGYTREQYQLEDFNREINRAESSFRDSDGTKKIQRKDYLEFMGYSIDSSIDMQVKAFRGQMNNELVCRLDNTLKSYDGNNEDQKAIITNYRHAQWSGRVGTF